MSKKNWGGYREGAGRMPLEDNKKKKGVKIYITDTVKEDIIKYGVGNSFSEKSVELIKYALKEKIKTDF